MNTVLRFTSFACLLHLVIPSFAVAAQKALLIGIGDYERFPYYSEMLRREFKDLKGPRNDVRILRQALIARYGFPEEAIRVLTDGEATRAKILSTFESWLVRGTKPGDLVVFYFSGHGTRLLDQNGDEDDGADEILVPYDAVPEGARDVIEARLILDDELGVLLRRLKDREVVVMIDACYSGTMIRGIRGIPVATLEETPAIQARQIVVTLQEPEAEARAFAPQWPRQPDLPEGHVFISASRENQLSVERQFPDGVWHGALTRALVEGMSQRRNRTYRELYEYARKEIKDQYKLDQEPQIKPARDVILDQAAFGAAVMAPVKPEGPRPQKLKPSTPPSLPAKPQPQVVTPQTPPPAPPSEAALPPSPLSVLQPPPEVEGEKVLVKIEPLRGGSPQLMNALHASLARLPYVEVVADGLFDRLIRGEVKDGFYRVRLLNGIGDVIPIPPTRGLETLIEALAPHLEYALIVKQLAHLRHPDPPFRVDLSVMDERRDFCIDRQDTIVYQLSCEEDCYPLLLNVGPTGNIHLLFPNRYYPEPLKLEAGRKLRIPDEKMERAGFQFQVFPPVGEETVKVIATNTSLDLERLRLGEFRELFKTMSGQALEASSPSRSLTRDILALITQKSHEEGFRWSEDTVVVRSHERCGIER